MAASPVIHIRSADSRDREPLVALLPQLADFALPNHRRPRHLWEGDGRLLEQVLSGETHQAFVDVAEAVGPPPRILGFVVVSLREELLSQAPSAHLETLVVSPEARRRGLGERLVAHTEEKVQQLGAESLTLHVFHNNHRARALYAKRGFEEELIRAVKWL